MNYFEHPEMYQEYLQHNNIDLYFEHQKIVLVFCIFYLPFKIFIQV